MRPSFSKPMQRVTKLRAKATFTAEIMGSGILIPGTPTAPQVAAAAPAWGQLLEACGMVAASVTAGNIGRTYTPTTTASTQKTATIYIHMNGQLHKLVGAMGTFSIDLTAGMIGTITFNMSGNYVAPVVVADPAGVATTVVPPLVGGGFSFNAGTVITDLNASKIAVDINNTVVPRMSIASTNGIDGFFITSRAPSYTIDPERTLESVTGANFFSQLQSVPLTATTLTVGTVSGNQCAINLAKGQLTGLQIGNRDNMLSYDLSYNLVSDTVAGNDELVITFK
jgi:hypothetical protein